MESQPQNPEFRNNPENFHPWSVFCRIYNRKSLFTTLLTGHQYTSPNENFENSYPKICISKTVLHRGGYFIINYISKYWTHWSSFKEQAKTIYNNKIFFGL